jgi:hypothetical protein
MKTTLATVTATVSLAALLALSGCSLLPPIPDLGGGSSSGDNRSDDSDNGDDVEDNPFLDHDLPDGFPSDVPLPDLEIYFSLAVTEDSWSIIYKADDLEADFSDIVDQFEGDGWEVLMNNATGDGSLGVFSKDPYQVQVLGVADGGSDFDGPGITYTVVRS